ncbi:lycopene cyclase family protein [Rhodococcus sp. HNM0569]|uniref:lycopene cyclase family protein n=1 Tax=Rhodococcus sp. HNM0569 TaxID=2716340 RepID=UPI00146D7875|nr:lycopene cyclase family protein [Rhodococcus sp. HNM0569]NLU81199.1 lycopene cyclase [Rhodococcus sp. HNM0569]
MRCFDVVVVGLGPAGRALAARCSALGARVAAVDPLPHAVWRATYAAWTNELPDWLPPDARAATVVPSAFARTRHTLARSYTVLDTARLQSLLDIGNCQIYAGRAVNVQRDGVLLEDGTSVRGRRVVDARGALALPGTARQTAFGLVLPTATASPALAGADAWFMDWREDNGAGPDEQASFLYAMPVGGDATLLEETCLVGRPPLPIATLATRLRARLAARGVEPDGTEPTERVSFAVESRGARGSGVLPFGARGPMMHPGSGFSLAAALRAADGYALALTSGGTPPSVRTERVVHGLRRAGLRTLLALDADANRDFFEAFFELPASRQAAYLSGHADIRGTVAAMAGVFRAVSPSLRWTVATRAAGC